jgi:PAS domain S-box-containing protein
MSDAPPPNGVSFIAPRDDYQQLFNHAADAVFVHGLDGRFTDVNHAACEMLGYAREELLTMAPWDFVVNDPRETIVRNWHHMDCGVPFTVDGVFRRKDGRTLPAQVRLVRFKPEDGKDLLIAVCRDVTSSKQIEQIFRNALESLAAQPRLDSFLRNCLTTTAAALCASAAALWLRSSESGTLALNTHHRDGGHEGRGPAPAGESPRCVREALDSKAAVTSTIADNAPHDSRQRELLDTLASSSAARCSSNSRRCSPSRNRSTGRR